jgi:hypothetical protein
MGHKTTSDDDRHPPKMPLFPMPLQHHPFIPPPPPSMMTTINNDHHCRSCHQLPLTSTMTTIAAVDNEQ